MKQIKVSIPDDLLTHLEEAAMNAERSLSEEVRMRLMGGAQPNQIGVALPDIVLASLKEAASKEGNSINEEINQRLQRTFVDDKVDPETIKLRDDIRFLAFLIENQTGQKWHSSAASTSVMKHAIDALLARFRGGDGKAEFLQDELPPKESRSLIADTPREMGIAMATVVGLIEDISAGRIQMPGLQRGMFKLDELMASVGKKSKGEEQ